MCVTPGKPVKTSKKYVVLIGLFGTILWLLPLVFSAIELKSYLDGERRDYYYPTHPHHLTRDYAIAGIAISAIYITPSLLMVIGALGNLNALIYPWLVIAIIYMTGISLIFDIALLEILFIWL